MKRAFLAGLATALATGTILAAACLASTAGHRAALLADGTVLDQAGRRIRPNGPFARIVSLYGAHTENLFALKLGRLLVGAGPHELFPPAARKLPAFSYRDDPERILAVRPDLVLTRPMIERGYPAVVRRLEQAGVTVVSLQPRTVQEMKGYWRILAALAGRRAAADRLADAFFTAVDRFRGLTAGLARRKRVFFEAIHSRMKTVAPDSPAAFVLQVVRRA